ncbi:MAG: glycosyltransferase family 4 protein [Methanomicrobiales archaeon]
MSNKNNIAIITLSVTKAGFVPVQKLFRIIKSISREVYLITGGLGANLKEECGENCHVYSIDHELKHSTISRIFNYIKTQFKYLIQLDKIIKNLDTIIFYIGAQGLILPLFLSKIYGKKVVLIFAGSPTSTARAKNDTLTGPISLLSSISCRFSDQIIVNSEGQIKEFQLEKYRDKIVTAMEHIIDFNKFNIKKEIEEREEQVGYVGRLSREKGIMNFLEAANILIKKGCPINFSICGEGDLEEEVKQYISDENLQDKAEFKGWISDEELPIHLNNLKLIVIPSYTEGLPNLMLEAMACGTPVLANSVGSIPEIIENGENGFLMKNNNPPTIVTGIIKAINRDNLNRISRNANEEIFSQFKIDIVEEKWSNVLKE